MLLDSPYTDLGSSSLSHYLSLAIDESFTFYSRQLDVLFPLRFFLLFYHHRCLIILISPHRRRRTVVAAPPALHCPRRTVLAAPSSPRRPHHTVFATLSLPHGPYCTVLAVLSLPYYSCRTILAAPSSPHCPHRTVLASLSLLCCPHHIVLTLSNSLVTFSIGIAVQAQPKNESSLPSSLHVRDLHYALSDRRPRFRSYLRLYGPEAHQSHGAGGNALAA
jgi:hypothetical protein